MKPKRSLLKASMIVLALCVASTATAQSPTSSSDIPRTISYQGEITALEGTSLPDGELPITVRFYRDGTGLDMVWEGTYITILRGGYFNVLLGSGENPLPDASVMDQPLWIGVSVNGIPADNLTPLSASPYALNVSDNAISTEKLADGAVTADKMGTNYISDFSVNGSKIAGRGIPLNLVGTQGIKLKYDAASRSTILKFDGKSQGGKYSKGKPGDPLYIGGNDWSDNDDGGSGGNNSNTVGGGRTNVANPSVGITTGRATIAGGEGNTASGQASAITGGQSNTASGAHSVIAGGQSNTASGQHSIVTGGSTNSASGTRSYVGGGTSNDVSVTEGTVGGGNDNDVTSSGTQGTIGGGANNDVTAANGTIAGGLNNAVSGSYGAIGGGRNNQATGTSSAIPGGQYMKVGDRTFAYNGDNSGNTTDISGMTAVAYFGEVDVMIGNYKSSSPAARSVRFYEPNSSLTYSGTHSSSFKAGTQSNDINYTWPTSTPSANQVLTATSVSSNDVTLGWATGGSVAFNNITTGTNTTAAMTVGTGGSILVTGTGIVEATKFKGSGSTTDAVDLATAEVAGQLSLTANVSGVLPVANGGTGASTLTGVLHGNGTSPVTAGPVDLTSEVSNTLPVGNGGTGATTLTGFVKGNGTSAFTAVASVNLNSADVSGTLPVASGGTGATTLPANAVLLGNGTSAVSNVAVGSGQVLIGTAAAPVSANLTAGTGINVTSGAGSITIASTNATVNPGTATHQTMRWNGTAWVPTGLLTSDDVTVPNIVTVNGNESVTGNLSVGGNAAVTGNSTVGGNSTITGTGTVTGAATFGNTISTPLGAGVVKSPGGGGALTSGAVNLASEVTGVLPVANGGTNTNALTANGILTANGAGTAVTSTAMTNGQVMIGSTGAAPVAATLTAGTNITIGNGAGTITINATGGLPSGTVDQTLRHNGTTWVANNLLTLSTSPSSLATVTGNFDVTGTTNLGTGGGNTTVGGSLYTQIPAGVVKSPGVGGALANGLVDLVNDVTGTLQVNRGGTGATTLTGIVRGNGTLPMTAGSLPLTDALLTGVLPISKGGTNSGTALNGNRIMVSDPTATSVVESGALGNGQVLIGSNAGAPIPATLTAGTGITITNAANSITITNSGAGAAGWLLAGNAGAPPPNNFVGTTDNNPLEIRVNNGAAATGGTQRVMRYEPNATSANILGGHNTNAVTAGAIGITIGGGGSNGLANTVTDDFGVVAGGEANQAGNNAGATNDASYATVSGGFTNIANGDFSTIPGGDNLTAQGYGQTVVGFFNTPMGGLTKAALPVGSANTDPIFLVGNGMTGNTSNAFAVAASGHARDYQRIGNGAAGQIPVTNGIYEDNQVIAWAEVPAGVAAVIPTADFGILAAVWGAPYPANWCILTLSNAPGLAPNQSSVTANVTQDCNAGGSTAMFPGAGFCTVIGSGAALPLCVPPFPALLPNQVAVITYGFAPAPGPAVNLIPLDLPFHVKVTGRAAAINP